MQLCDPWTSGDGAEASIWDGLREDILPRDIDPLAARIRSPSGMRARVTKAPTLGPFCVSIEEERYV